MLAKTTRQPPLSVATAGNTSASPSPGPSSGSMRNRPHGARRRALPAPGLYIANPDASDSEEAGSPSPVRMSPVRSSSSPLRSSSDQTSPLTAASASSLGRVRSPGFAHGHPPSGPSGSAPNGFPTGPSASAPPASGGSSSPRLANALGGGRGRAGSNGTGGTSPSGYGPSVSPSDQHRGNPLPVPPSSATSATFETGGPPPPSYTAHVSPPLPGHEHRPMPPLPPPQPERHMRRAYTAPNAEQAPKLHIEQRSTTGPGRDPPPASPTRALPPLPGIRAATIPSPTNQSLSQPTYSVSPPTSLPTPASATSTPSLLSTANRVSSPDDGQNGRQRSDSVQKTLLQVTTDNEQFAVVDITGIYTPEAIRERIFSKVCPVQALY